MALGVAARNSLIVTAAGVVLILRVLGLDHFFPMLERRGLEAGLIFLLMAVLVPFATGEVGWAEIRASFTSWTGLAAVAGRHHRRGAERLRRDAAAGEARDDRRHGGRHDPG